MSGETKELPAVTIDGTTWKLHLSRPYMSAPATLDDLAAILAALPDDERAAVLPQYIKDNLELAITVSVERTRERNEARGRASAAESALTSCTRELDEERAKVGLMMQPMPGETFPGESSPVWRMLQQWTANRDVEKRAERERLASETRRREEVERELAALRLACEAYANNRLPQEIQLPEDDREVDAAPFLEWLRSGKGSPPWETPPPADTGEKCGRCGGTGCESSPSTTMTGFRCEACNGTGQSPSAKDGE